MFYCLPQRNIAAMLLKKTISVVRKQVWLDVKSHAQQKTEYNLFLRIPKYPISKNILHT